MNALLPYVQITTAALLIVSIVLQQSGAGLSETFGGSGAEAGFHTRRGLEKTLFRATIVLGIFFVLSSITAIIV